MLTTGSKSLTGAEKRSLTCALAMTGWLYLHTCGTAANNSMSENGRTL
jgi:hypothetical protein